MTKFDAKTFSVSSDVYNTIAGNQAAIDGDKAQSADALGRIKSAKLDNIVQLVCGLAVVPLTQKGNLPTSVSSAVKSELQEKAMQTKGMAENIVKYVAGTRRHFNINVNRERRPIARSYRCTSTAAVDVARPRSVQVEAPLLDRCEGSGIENSHAAVDVRRGELTSPTGVRHGRGGAESYAGSTLATSPLHHRGSTPCEEGKVIVTTPRHRHSPDIVHVIVIILILIFAILPILIFVVVVVVVVFSARPALVQWLALASWRALN